MKTGLLTDRKTKRLALDAMMLGAALILSFVESIIPGIVPVPGFKPGLANIVIMAAFSFSPADAAVISLSRVLISSLLFGSPVSLILSLAGAVLSYLFLLAVKLFGVSRLSWIGVSVPAAALHNIGQLAAASLIMNSTGIFGYYPVMALSSVVCGAVSGLLMNLLCKKITALRDKIYN